MPLKVFFAGIFLLVLAFGVFTFVTDPTAGTHLVFTLGEAVGSVMAGLILGLIVWAPFRIIHGVEKAPDVRRFTLYTAAILVAVFIVFRYFVGTPLSKSARLAFASGFERTCFSTQRSLEENFTFNDSQLREYCSCVASSLSEKVTEEELKYLAAYKTFPGTLQEKSQQVGEQCSQELVRKRQGRNL